MQSIHQLSYLSSFRKLLTILAGLLCVWSTGAESWFIAVPLQRVLGLLWTRRTAFRCYVASPHKFIKKINLRRKTKFAPEFLVVNLPVVHHFGLCFIRSLLFVLFFIWNNILYMQQYLTITIKNYPYGKGSR